MKKILMEGWGSAMAFEHIPAAFLHLQQLGVIAPEELEMTRDGFCLAYKSLARILGQKQIFDFSDHTGARFACDRFYDDWFLFAVPYGDSHIYGLLKLREQEYDALEGVPADGDTPGVTVSFIAFRTEILFDCLASATEEARRALDAEINRVVSRRGQRHHKGLKGYFADPRAQGAYLVAEIYTGRIAGLGDGGYIPLPEAYKEILGKHSLCPKSAKYARLPLFLQKLQEKAGCRICDGEKLYIRDAKTPTAFERDAILATHTGNVSVYSFAAEVAYHAAFLVAPVRLFAPFVYESAIRADMTVGDKESEGTAPFHRTDSFLVKRQYRYHKESTGK